MLETIGRPCRDRTYDQRWLWMSDPSDDAPGELLIKWGSGCEDSNPPTVGPAKSRLHCPCSTKNRIGYPPRLLAGRKADQCVLAQARHPP